MNKKAKQTIYFHGTTSMRKAKSILRNGFNKGTYFAKHLEDAIEFGGKYVFEVAVSFPPNRSWQACSANHISKDAIISLSVYSKKKIYEK